MRSVRGLSLLEMLAALAALAVLTVVAVPAVQNWILDARMTAAVNSFVHVIQLSRHKASQNRWDVVTCRSSSALQCDAPGDWTDGWIVFENRDGDDPPAVDSGEPILHAVQSQAIGSIISNRPAYVLRPFGLRATNGTLVFCDRRGASDARAVIVSYTGRPRTTRRTASGQALSCPSS